MNVDAIFDAFGKLSQLTVLADKQREKQAQIKSVNEKRCGNCYHWMKSSCIPEKQHKKFKSTSSRACKDFHQCPAMAGLSDAFEIELKDINEKIREATA